MESKDNQLLSSLRLNYDRIIDKREFQNYASWYGNEEAMKFVTLKALKPEEIQLKFEKMLEDNMKHPEIGVYSVKLKENGKYIGLAKLSYYNTNENRLIKDQVEVGYGLLPKFWGKGYATEICRTLINFAKGFSHIKGIIADVHPENIFSKKILFNQGFVLYNTTVEENEPVEYHRLNLEGIK